MKNRRILTIITILYTGFIFCNSMMPALESSKQSEHVLAAVLGIIDHIGWNGGWITEYLIRKAAHYTEYTVLGILLAAAVRSYSFETSFRRILQCFLGLLIPFADETIQLFVEGRSGQISDVWLDMAGVFTGYLLIGIILRMKKAGKKNRS